MHHCLPSYPCCLYRERQARAIYVSLIAREVRQRYVLSKKLPCNTPRILPLAVCGVFYTKMFHVKPFTDNYIGDESINSVEKS